MLVAFPFKNNNVSSTYFGLKNTKYFLHCFVMLELWHPYF